MEYTLIEYLLTAKGIATAFLFIILFFGLLKFWDKLNIEFFMPLLCLLFLCSKWGNMVYDKCVEIINESIESVAVLMNIPKWTFSYQASICFLVILYVVYLGYSLFSRIMSGTSFLCCVAMQGILYYIGLKEGLKFHLFPSGNLKNPIQYNLFYSSFENLKQLGMTNYFHITANTMLCYVMLAGVIGTLCILCWEISRAFDWQKLADDDGIKWFQVVLFVLLLISPVTAFIIIGLLPFQYHAFHVRTEIQKPVFQKEKKELFYFS